MNFPNEHPCLFWTLAIGLSIFYALRSIILQRELHKDDKLPVTDQIFLYYIQDMIYNFVGGMAGWISLFAIYSISSRIEDPSKIETGTGVILVFLIFTCISGISGKLPELMHRGITPGQK